ncbi:plasma-membrane proton-efflux P-type ATPase [Beijerinckia mobilis]|uniref:plasma-membrane proton-efflux P-type ATPase n=1 Tax=Beijerinckia mobilis TaxID=231434 RepID=UPI0006910DC5|nr:plasma-membrane proton-efflux P-type ATPase [Beijerinckia mobilis]
MDQPSSSAKTDYGLTGLTEEEARRRLAHYGQNVIPEQHTHPLIEFLKKLWGPIPWMLEAVILLQFLLGKSGEAAVIGALLGVNALISFVEEGRAGKALDLLRHRLAANARVLRGGCWRSIVSAELVPGDIVHLRMGDLSPADIHILEGGILLDQSSLTGESLGVEAGAGATAYAAAIVRRGEATGEVIATGPRTRFGKTAELVRTARSTSHLAEIIFKIVRILIAIDAVLISALLVYAFWAGLPPEEVLSFALILIVASVPAALPATFTLATALGAAELARSGVLLTRLSAIEEAAGMDVLCTDKTGTLTENRLTLAALTRFTASSDDELLRFAALASDPATQDPIDLAILSAAAARNLLAAPPRRIDFIPFDPASRYSLGHYEGAEAPLWVVKGAPQAVAALVAGAADKKEAINQEVVTREAITRLAASGARVLAVGQGTSRADLRLAGLIALEDPPRADSAALVEGLKELGIKVIMVTGDDAVTANAIAKRIGIDGPVASADMVASLDSARALDYGVYARVFPEDKIRLIRLLQSAGHIVGMTGDGVNDAPALRQADVGVAVASATDVARAAAGVALTAPGLTDMLTAVRISRHIYQRMLTYTINKIMKTIEIAVFLTIGVIITQVFVITPFLIVLLLFTNDFVTMSIATDNVSYSPQPDRWDLRLLMLTGGVLAALVLILSFSVFFVGRDLLGLTLGELQTLVFLMLVATGQGNVYLVRERGPFWRSRPSFWLMTSSILDLLAVTAMASLGIFMTPVSFGLILLLLGVVAAYLLVLDQLKVVLFRCLAIQ